MKSLLCWSLVLGLLLPIASNLQGQEGYTLLNRDAMFAVLDSNHLKKHGLHTSVRPFRASEVSELIDRSRLNWPFAKNTILDNGNRQDESKALQFRIFPLGSLEFGSQLEPVSKSLNETSIGAGMSASLSDKLFLNLNVQSFQASVPTFLEGLIEERSTVPGGGYAFGTENGYHYKNNSGFIAYQPNKTFDFQMGYGKHFFGDGYRSLLLSDMAHNYGYLKVSTQFWKIKYVNLFANLKDVRESGGNPSDFTDKYATIHYLSYNATKWLSIGLFESVVWQGSDTLVERGFDVNYLNPVIFFRPVEFSTGSADNSLIGLNLKIRASKHLQFYGQVILDEFLLDEFRARNGWWGNKQGAQAGFRLFELFGIKGLSWQGEFNTVRPFTYTHGSVTQNYAHYNQPLAHPLGANFNEVLSFLTYRKENWLVEARFQLIDGGKSSFMKNKGEDLYLSNTTRVEEYGHSTSQGEPYGVRMLGVRGSYLIWIPSNLRVEAGYAFRRQDLPVRETHMLYFGLRTALGNRYTDF